jgi:integrase
MKITSQTVRGTQRTVVEWVDDGKRRRKFCRSANAAKQFVASSKKVGKDLASLLDTLPHHKQLIVAQAVTEADRAGIDILSAVRIASSHLNRTISIPISQAITHLIAAKRNQNCRQTYVKELRYYLLQWSRGQEERPISHVTREDIDLWFAARKFKPITKRGELAKIKTLFSHAISRGWITQNPCAGLKIIVDLDRPAILTVEQSASLIATTHKHFPDWIPYITLALFAGIRPIEIHRLAWDDIDLNHATVRIDAAASKVRHARFVYLTPNAVNWLKLGGAFPRDTQATLRALHRIRKKANIASWVQDIMRHTAASMLVASTNDPARVALELGHSQQILFTHYRNLVTKSDAEKFFAINPE